MYGNLGMTVSSDSDAFLETGVRRVVGFGGGTRHTAVIILWGTLGGVRGRLLSTSAWFCGHDVVLM